MSTEDSPRCPCRSGRPFAECCGPFLAGGLALTAEALMRSRYTAYALGDEDHVLRTWHPDTAPSVLDLSDGVTFVGLQVVDTVAGGVDDDAGTVHFRAAYRTETGREVLEEISRFVRLDGAWLYVDGDILST
ncbi:YchJ family protein [Miniimonas arenae]|uniref:YchJ family protein n=1 Tax=Miniimonas arenae TaxID=676201 RepID=UPI0028A79580|nr:YchJ family metal-binding protein [Miniimonas arenae]